MRYVWLVETYGESESQEVFGTRRRAVDYLVGVEVFDEARRDECDDNGDPLPDDPMRALSKREINAEINKSETQTFAMWPVDGAGNTFLSITRRIVR